jgi:transcriptional regulator of arginine metabolism
MSSTRTRRDALIKLIGERPIYTQNELVSLLKEIDVPATQSSVSRDISHLGLIKAGGRYILPGTGNASAAPPVPILESGTADSFAIVKVPPGQAAALGAHLDGIGWPEILGTLAGDDTLLIICRDRMSRNAVLARLSNSYRGPKKNTTAP